MLCHLVIDLNKKLCAGSDEDETCTEKKSGIADGFAFLKNERGILYIMLTMALINFFSRLTYENILSPMILARSSGNSMALGMVNAGMGIGGIVSGAVVSIKKESRHKAAGLLGKIVGNGTGNGMAVMFLCTGICGFAISIASCFNRKIRNLD